MRKIILLLALAIVSSAISYSQEVQNEEELDSLLSVYEKQTGVEKLKTCHRIGTYLSFGSIDRAQQYAFESVYEGEQMLNSNISAEEKNEVRYQLVKLYHLVANSYYMIASRTDDEQIHQNSAAKVSEYAGIAQRMLSKVRYPEKIDGYDPAIPVSVNQLHVIYYMLKGNVDSALYYNSKAMDYCLENDLKVKYANMLQNRANLHITAGQLEESKKCLIDALAALDGEEGTDPLARRLVVTIYENLAAVEVNTGNFDKGEEYINKTLELVDEDKDFVLICYCYGGLSEIAEARGDYKGAFEHYKTYKAYEDSLFNKTKAEQIAALEVKYDTYQKETAIKTLKNQKAMIVVLVVVLVVIIALIAVYANVRRRANKVLAGKNKEIQEQRDRIAEQRDELNTMLVELSDNISYASLLQNRIMIGDRNIREIVSESFVIYSPKDVVGGDFFYVKQCGDYKIIAVADCTGHGISAAMLTIVNISLLNEYFAAANEVGNNAEFDRYFDPASILETLRANVKKTLNARSNETIAMSGMDMAMMVHKKGDSEVRFAGANRPLYVVREDKELVEIKPVRNPIASYVNEKVFETHNFEYKDSDMFYMFSDGMTDQFSVDGATKLKAKGLKEILVKHSAEEEQLQKKSIMEDFNKFRGRAEQLDDFMLVGVRGSSL